MQFVPKIIEGREIVITFLSILSENKYTVHIIRMKNKSIRGRNRVVG